MREIIEYDGKYFEKVTYPYGCSRCDLPCKYSEDSKPGDTCKGYMLKELKIVNNKLIRKEDELKFGDIIEVTNQDEWPEYPFIERFHSYNESGGVFIMVSDGGRSYMNFKHARKLKI